MNYKLKNKATQFYYRYSKQNKGWINSILENKGILENITSVILNNEGKF